MADSLPAAWKLGPLEGNVDRTSFDCKTEALNTFIRQYARQNDAKRISKTFIASIPESDRQKVIGYYTLSAAQNEFQDLPDRRNKANPH
jgi:hypothetical protein